MASNKESSASAASSTLHLGGSEGDNVSPSQSTPFKFNPVQKAANFEFRRLPYKDSIVQWIHAPGQKASEERVLQFLPFFPEPDATRKARISNVEIGKNCFIHQFKIQNTLPVAPGEKKKNIVVMHGYGAGLGFFFQNFNDLSKVDGSTVYALDWLGFGLSSRPRFSIPTKDFSVKESDGYIKAVRESEDWFLDALEKWRKHNKLESFILIGHSLGGYLSTAYAMKYPNRVEKLILISPAGVDRGYSRELDKRWPWGRQKSAKATLDEANIDLAKSLSTKQPTAVPGNGFDDHTLQQLESVTRTFSQDTLSSEKSTSRIHMPKMVTYMWNNHWSPFDLLRGSFFFGPRLISEWTHRRFGSLPAAEQDAMHIYAFRTLTARGSGEYAITRLLAPGALARMPLVDRVTGRIKCPSLWLYGDSDWMNVDAGDEATKRLRRAGLQADFHVIQKAGHHTYLDNPVETNKLIMAFVTADSVGQAKETAAVKNEGANEIVATAIVA